jgi:hypothetical protein
MILIAISVYRTLARFSGPNRVGDAASWRFSQYQYRVRLIGEGVLRRYPSGH